MLSFLAQSLENVGDFPINMNVWKCGDTKTGRQNQKIKGMCFLDGRLLKESWQRKYYYYDVVKILEVGEFLC